MVYLTKLSIAQAVSTHHRLARILVKKNLERTWKETLLQNPPGTTEGTLTGIRTGYFPNIRHFYSCIRLGRCFNYLQRCMLCTFALLTFRPIGVWYNYTWPSISFEVMLPSACSFIVDGIVEQQQLNVRQRTIYNKAARRRQHNLKTYWTIQCSRMLKYSIILDLAEKLCLHVTYTK
jgi:hypothetical protein